MNSCSQKTFMKKDFLWIIGIVMYFLIIVIILDWNYYNCREIWSSDQNFFGKICGFIWRKGFRYTDCLGALKKNFGILISTVSIIITISIHNLNRLETRFLGLPRSRYDFSKPQIIYQCGRILAILTPILMPLAVFSGLCITGCFMLLFCYVYIVGSYLLFERSFHPQHDLECLRQTLCNIVPENAKYDKDILDYKLLLEEMRLGNDKENSWNYVFQLFRSLLEQIGKVPLSKSFVLCCYFYKTMFIGINKINCEPAANALKEYIIQKDAAGWDGDSYLILWGMLHCLFLCDDKKNIFLFFKWYSNFPSRYRELSEKVAYGKTNRASGSIQMSFSRDAQMQAGILLTEFESFLRKHSNPDDIGSEIQEILPTLWEMGKHIFSEDFEEFRNTYLRISYIYDPNTDAYIKVLQNLCEDFQYGTARSLTVCHIRYKGEL